MSDPTPEVQAEIDWLRRLLEDVGKARRERSSASGSDAVFAVATPPIIADSESVAVDGELKVRGTDYELSPDRDRVLFNAPPPADATVTIEYRRATFEDSELEQLLAAANWAPGSVGRVYRAATLAIDGLLTGAATALDFGSGESEASMSSVFDRLVRLRAVLASTVAEEAKRPGLVTWQ